MPRPAKGPRIWFDRGRGSWVIRDGEKFIRTGAEGWAKAEDCLRKYLRERQLPFKVAKPTVGFVYFISAEYQYFPIKIGFTEKLNSVRLQSIQTGCPYPIYMMAWFAGGFSDESALHRKFKADRLKGEWFSRTPALLELIEQHKISEAA